MVVWSKLKQMAQCSRGVALAKAIAHADRSTLPHFGLVDRQPACENSGHIASIPPLRTCVPHALSGKSILGGLEHV